MSFSQAVSGLNAASTNLDVIGNNIANSATSGFKSATASFADMFAGSQTGMGVKVAAITQDFSDGTTSTTNRGLDVALSGNGFFRLTDATGGVFYSRNGQLSLNENRQLVNTQGLSVTGYPATGTPPTIAQGAQPVAMTIPNTMMIAKASTAGTMVANLNSTDKVPTTTTFNSSDDSSYNYVNTLTTYDSLGNSHDNNVYFVKTAANNWDVWSQDTSVSPAAAAGKIGSLTFNENGTLRSSTTPGDATATPVVLPVTSTPAVALSLPLNVANNGAVNPQTVQLNFAGSIQQNTGSNSIGSLTQDGYAAGQMTGYTINDDGTVSGVYSNQKTQLLGQIVLSNFSNPEGLKSEGDNVWSSTQSSGQPITGVAGSGGFGNMTSGALEASNVDLSKELVNMIVAQRNYQSNAQTIKTQDSILNTLVNLR